VDKLWVGLLGELHNQLLPAGKFGLIGTAVDDRNSGTGGVSKWR